MKYEHKIELFSHYLDDLSEKRNYLQTNGIISIIKEVTCIPKK